MMWYILTISGWILVGGVCALSIYSEIKHKKQHKETLEEHNQLKEKYMTLSQSYAKELETRWKCEGDLIDVKLNHQKDLSVLKAENERIKLKYERQLDKSIELMEKIIWVDENKRGDT